MALIPITFKADLGSNNAKGNLRAEDLSALFAFNYPNKAGILSITGTDCEQFGNINVVGSTAQITFHKGYIVVYGKAIYIEEGTEVAFNLPSSGSVSGVLGIKINLAESGANEVTWFQKTTESQTDNLLQKPSSGIYEFVLYNYTATANTFTLGAKTTEIIYNIDTYIENKNFVNTENLNTTLLGLVSEFISYNNIANAKNGRQLPHYWTEFTIRDYRIIFGAVNVLEANTNVFVTWDKDKFIDSSWNNGYKIIPGFTTETRNDNIGMDEPTHVKTKAKNGFVFYNSNGYTVTGTYIAIGKYK